jgi:hypothetical protein
MGWKKRGNHSYYYRQRREGGRLVSEYIGAGLLAELTAAQVADHREERMRARLRLAQQRREHAEMEEQIEQISELIEEHLAAELVAAGYHRHKREWRRRRQTRATE